MKKILLILGFLFAAVLVARPVPVLSAAGNVICLGLPALVGDATLSAGTCTTAVGKILGVTVNSVPTSGNLVGTTDTQTLSGKTLASPALSGTVTGNGTVPLSILAPQIGSIASATVVDLGASFASGSFVTISGTTTITSFGSTAPAGSWYFVQFSGNLTLTNGANLNLAGGNTTTPNSPIFIFAVPTIAGTWYGSNPLSAIGGFSMSPGGSISGSSLSPTGSSVPGVGLYRPAANSLGFSTNTTVAGRIDALQRLLWGYTVDQGGGELLQVNSGAFINGKVTATSVLDSGLAASAPVVSTDASKNLTNTAPTQTANTVYAGPTTGAAASPTFRALVTADLPATGGTGSGAEAVDNFSPGLVSSVTSVYNHYTKWVKASTVDNMIASAMTLTCTGNPTVTFYECGSSASCSAPTTIASVTVTATGTATPATISSSAIAAGDYTAWQISAGTCAALDIGAKAQVHAN